MADDIKSEALLCAEVLEATRDDPMWADHSEITKEACHRSAAELRRLHAQRDALLEALKRALPHAEDSMARPELDIDILDARAAIKMAEEGK